MKVLLERWIGTPNPFATTALFKRLETAQAAHISDLRVLIDKGNEREAMLASLLAQSMPQKRQGSPMTRESAPIPPVLPLEQFSDVATFDESADQEEAKRQSDKMRELQAELDLLLLEQATEGMAQA